MEKYCVGARIRVMDREGKSSCLATISYIDDSNNVVDLILEDSLQEECGVSVDRLSELNDFEQLNDRKVSDVTAFTLKEYGNAVFSSKDFSSAIHYYTKALDLLNAEPISIGSEVLVLVRNAYFSGMVSSVEPIKSLVEVELDYDEEITVKQSDAIALSRSLEDLKLQRSLYLNLAKCAHKKCLRGWAVRYSSIAIAVLDFIFKTVTLADADVKELQKAKVDSHYFRGRVLLECNRPKNAEKVPSNSFSCVCKRYVC
jgi:tetratricopeptide (TPR) repeat protein